MTTVQKIQELRKKYQTLKDIIAKDISEWDPRTRTGMEGLKNRSKQDINTVRPALVSAILSNSTTAIVTDDVANSKEIIEAVLANGNTMIAIDFLKLERDLIKGLYPNQAGTSYSVNTDVVSRMNRMIAELGTKLGVASMPAIQLNGVTYGSIPSKEALIAKLHQILTDTYDNELKSLYVGHLIGQALEDRLNETALTVVIANVPVSFTGPMSKYTGRAVVLAGKEGIAGALVANESTTPEKFINVFETIRLQDAKSAGEGTTDAETVKATKPRTKRVNPVETKTE